MKNIHSALTAKLTVKKLSVTKYFLLVSTVVILLQNCTQQTKLEQRLPGVQTIQENLLLAEVPRLLKEAKISSSPIKEQTLVQASHTLIKHNEYQQASDILQNINIENLNTDYLAVYHFHQTEILLSKQQTEKAIEWLDLHVNPSLVSLENQIRYSKLKAKTLVHNGQYLSSAKERIYIGPLLPLEQKKTNNELTWITLSQLETHELETSYQNENDPNVKAWIELIYINKAFQNDIDAQSLKFDAWANEWKLHDAASALPETISQIQKAVKERPKNIAFLLPESGPLAKSAAAIKQGFMLEYYQALNKESFTPEIKFYDSSDNALKKLMMPVNENESINLENAFLLLYKKAISEGAEFIIGPMDKDHIAVLEQQVKITTPTLALNYSKNEINKKSAHSLLFQFGLAPEDEIAFISEQAFLRSYKNAAILAPEGPWGERLTQTFAQQWSATGGKVVSTVSYKDERSISPTIKEMLNIDKSEQRFSRLYRYSENKALFFPRRRQDIDFIYLVSSPEIARQIMPTLSFHYANDIPVFSSSSIYDGKHNEKDKDLNRLVFTDIPWMLEQQKQQQMTEIWPHFDYRYARLVGMGSDAYQLSFRINILKASSNNKLYGATGILTLDENSKIRRQPALARFYGSQPKNFPIIINQRFTETYGLF